MIKDRAKREFFYLYKSVMIEGSIEIIILEDILDKVDLLLSQI